MVANLPRYEGYDWTKCICDPKLKSINVFGPTEGLDPNECSPGSSSECNPECEPCNESYQDWLSGPGDW